MTLRVSFIVPLYQQYEYLPHALESIALLDGDECSANVVVVNDGSTDCTERQVESVASDATVLHHGVNRGKIAALNSSSDHLDGDWVVVLDADDRVLPGFVRELHGAALAAGADFAYSGCRLVDEAGEEIGHGRSLPFRPGLIDEYSFIPDNALTRRDLFESVLPLDESVRILPKHYRWQVMCGEGASGAYVDAPLFEYRMHDANMSGVGAIVRSDLADGLEEHPLLSGYWRARVGTADDR
ncbi:MAG: glycosyltransferase family 2 protein [Actinomycetota bacterium]